MTTPSYRVIGDAPYARVTTFRKDGRAVPTPVWVVTDGDAVSIWTAIGTGKVKRVRRNAAVLVAPCDFRGRVTGDEVSGTASILDSEGTERVRALLRLKYGLMGRLTLWGSKLRRGLNGTVAIRIVLSD